MHSFVTFTPFCFRGSAKMRFFPKRQKTLDRNRKFDLFDLPSQESAVSSYFRHKLTNFRECSATVCESLSLSKCDNFFAICRGGNKDK